jgi:hypothetical protein
MLDYQWRLMMANDRIDSLRRSAARRSWEPAAPPAPEPDRREVELRLCKVSDDEALADLAVLAGQPLPFGRLVVAIVDGRLVAAVPLGGGRPLADPFERTEHLVRLLELRAAQLREPEPRRSLLPRAFGLLRHA